MQAMRNRNRFLLFFVLLTTGISAQQVPVPPKEAASRPPIGERDKAREDQVAKLFETIRIDAKLPRLARIRHRDSLEQHVCTVAATNVLPKNSVRDTFFLYKTFQPESISTELKQVASFDDDRFPRYSVAVWRVKNPQAGEAAYWVGVERYWSAAFEFFDYHFTDDIYHHNDWKKYVAPECRGR
jgi:hypothetical protein